MDKKLWKVVVWLILATLIFVAAIVLAASQAASTTTAYYYDKQTNHWGIDYAAKVWSMAGYQMYEVESCEGLDNSCVEISRHQLDPETFALTGGGLPVKIWVNDYYSDWPQRYRRQAMCHEFGHFIGFEKHRPASCMEAHVTGRYLTP